MGPGHTPMMGAEDRQHARALSLRGVRPPVRVPGYEQEAFLGHGAYGEVWVAVDSNSGRKVAIKYYTRRAGTDWAALAREVEKLRYLFNDRHIVQLLKVGWEADPPYYVMEYMEHGSLEDLLRRGPLSAPEAVALFREIAVGLIHAHNRGILHCDLKPANVLLDHDRRPRLADFGQSRLTNELSPALGTLFYMAPEQADLTAAPDARWDVYALGAVMYRILTASPPYRDEAGAGSVVRTGKLEEQLAAYRKLIQSAPPPSAHRKVPGVDPGLARIVDRCLAASPRNRYPNPQAVLSALDAWSLQRVRRPFLLLTGVGFAALLMGVGLIATVLFRDAVETARAEVLDRALEANRFAARAEAHQMALETEHRWRVLQSAAADPRLREWLAAGPALRDRPDQERELDAWLAAQKAEYDRDFAKGARASVWMALDRGGYMRGMSPSFPQYRHRYYGHRSYFTGEDHDLDDKAGGPPVGVITRPCLSVAYRRRTTRTWAVAFSVPVPPADRNGGPVGVLAMAVDLRQEELPPGGLSRFSVLVDTRKDATGRPGLVVRHPYMATLSDEADEENLPLYYADRAVELARERPAGWQRVPGYRDPVDREPFGGEWLAAVEPVVVRVGNDEPRDTGFVVVVQERQDEVLVPIRGLQRRLGYGAAGAGGFVLVLGLLLWGGMVYLLDASSRSRVSRLLRRWAGLPAGGTSGTAGTGTAGTGTAGTGTGGSPPGSAPPSPPGSAVSPEPDPTQV